MGDLSRPQLAVYGAAALAIVLIGARYLHESRPTEPAGGGRPVPVRVSSADGGWAVVQVAGEVHRPGVYRLRSSERVDDAVRMAGGATPRADLSGVNLAAKVEDGRQVIVPPRGQGAPGAGTAPGTTASAAGAGGPTAAPLNLNTATAEQLDQLDGVGPATARKIIAYRQQHGGFRSVSELDQVPGIGPKRMAALKDHLRT
jgi:competence protein ComEA